MNCNTDASTLTEFAFHYKRKHGRTAPGEEEPPTVPIFPPRRTLRSGEPPLHFEENERASSGSTNGDGMDPRDRSPSVTSSIPSLPPPSAAAATVAPFTFPQHRMVTVGQVVVSVALQLDSAVPGLRALANRIQNDRQKNACLQYSILEILRRGVTAGTFIRDQDGYRLKYERSPWPNKDKYIYLKNGSRLACGDLVTFTLVFPPSTPVVDLSSSISQAAEMDQAHGIIADLSPPPLPPMSRFLAMNLPRRPPSSSPLRSRPYPHHRLVSSPTPAAPAGPSSSSSTPHQQQQQQPQPIPYHLDTLDDPITDVRPTPPPLPALNTPHHQPAQPPPQSSTKRPHSNHLTITLPTQHSSASPHKRPRINNNTNSPITASTTTTTTAGPFSSSSKELSADDRETILEAFRQISSPARGRGAGSNDPATPGFAGPLSSPLDGITPKKITINRTIVVQQSLLSTIMTPIKNALFGSPKPSSERG
ncbi:hypothetical protein PhCBS80983_g04950 [Powellomyces hirtus]|uniref:Uncharacterized protein n=1 Tax=Powellomyces hirtus TaxID=109895 RepID=A0A507DYH7_9FUNG|nr:hypothetical protein PhCBS80983_g04950 [Powellomyces hirtus]